MGNFIGVKGLMNRFFRVLNGFIGVNFVSKGFLIFLDRLESERED